MVKALFLDLDETLCDTTGANNQALAIMGNRALELYPQIDKEKFCQHYLRGIYRDLTEHEQSLFLPIVDEGKFRLDLIVHILEDLGIEQCNDSVAKLLQQTFDQSREKCFDFFPNIKEQLNTWREHFTLVVITNGPEFSQLGKVAAVQLDQYVDHIIIGGQEPEQKPALSIFEKALTLAKCQADEVIHIGDSLSADIAGAQNANIRSIWVSHGNELDHQSSIKPTHTVEHPSEIHQLITSLIVI